MVSMDQLITRKSVFMQLRITPFSVSSFVAVATILIVSSLAALAATTPKLLPISDGLYQQWTPTDLHSLT